MMTTEIRARITANAAGFSAGLRDAERQVAGFQSRIERSFRGLNRLGAGLAGLAGGGLAAGALDQLTRSALNSAGAIADAARAAGVGAETLQEYRAAAKLAGIEQETLDSALQVFSRSLGDARRGNDSLADTFRRIGVTASDTAEGALDKTFSALAGIRDETVRASVAQDVFGRSGVRLAALVADGADSLAEARKQARELGLVLSNETVRGADAAGDRIEFLDAQMRTRLQTTILQNIEGFESYHSLLNDLSRAAVQFAARLGPAATAIQNFYDAVRGAGLPADASLSRLIEERETIASEIKNAAEGAQRGRELAEAAPFSFGAARDFADARQRRAGELSQQLRQIDRAIAEARAAQNALQKTITQGAGGEGDGDGFGDLGAPGAVGRFAGIEGPTLKIDAFNKRLADSQARIDAIAESIRTPFEELRAQLA
ncbi:MAG TPA: hypothetical protein DDZ68_04465, partial [Parvularcula sp.]|nr:hypothetical protein [Parvularcula sp.]